MAREQREYNAHPGDHIENVARKMAESANRSGVSYFCDFNGVELFVRPGMSPDTAVENWQAETKARIDAYSSSPEGIAAQAKRNAEYAEQQGRHDALMQLLPDQFQDHVSAITWMIRYVKCACWTYIKNRNYDKVNSTFKASGYIAGDAVGRPEIDYMNADVMSRYVVGQFMDGLSRGIVHDNLVIRFGEDALARLAVDAQP